MRPGRTTSTTGLDPYQRWCLCRSRGVHGSGRTVGEMVPAGVRQRPLFRGWPAADGAVLAKSADVDSFVVALAGSRCKRNGVDIVSQLSTGS